MFTKFPLFLVTMIVTLCVVGVSPARANKVLPGVTLQGGVRPGAKAPGEVATGQLMVSASVPAGQSAMNVDNAGFTFSWPAEDIIKERLNVETGQWAVTPLGAVILTPSPSGGNATLQNHQMANLSASFPMAGSYRIRIKAKASWWAGAGDTYNGLSDELIVAVKTFGPGVETFDYPDEVIIGREVKCTLVGSLYEVTPDGPVTWEWLPAKVKFSAEELPMGADYPESNTASYHVDIISDGTATAQQSWRLDTVGFYDIEVVAIARFKVNGQSMTLRTDGKPVE